MLIPWQIFELLTGGDYLFDPASGSRYSKDDDHIAQIMELMGEFPKSVAFSGKYSSDFFNRKGTLHLAPPFHCAHWCIGELRHIQKLRFWPLQDVLHDKYLLPKDEADLIASFLTPMLRLVPEKRAKASELIHHAWLDGVVVQGDIDIIRRAEEDDARRRAITNTSAEGGGKEKVEEDDAMKPVDEAVAADDVPKIAVPVPSSSSAKENARIPTLHSVPHHAKTGSEHKR